jgi:hypothetical protein
MATEKTLGIIEIELYENEIGQLRRELERVNKCCTQRGARMQIMREWMLLPRGLGPPTEWEYFTEERPESKQWFDADGAVAER